MLKRFKISHMLAMASLLLAIVGFGFSNKAVGQEACPFIDNDTGWLRLDVTTSSDFTAGLLGTVENFNGQIIGGIDWLYKNDNFETFFVLPTDTTGGQLISWWTQKDGRNTYIQVTNDGFFAGFVDIHVKILGEDCSELRDFCDTLSPFDTHIYNFGDLVSNTGQDIEEAILQGKEGIVVITPVEDCPDGSAVAYDNLQGSLRVIDSANIVEYGTNVYTRRPIQGECTESFDLCFSDAECNANVCDADTGTCTVSNDLCTTDADCPANTCDLSVCSPFDPVDGITCRFENIVPVDLSHDFSILAGGPAGADLVLMSINDSYGPPYTVDAGVATYRPHIYDADEGHQSCSPFSACFARLGVDAALPVSEEFTPPRPTQSPTPPPTPCETDADCPEGFVCNVEAGVCEEVVVTPTPTPEGGGGGGGCAIAGGPVQAGTAMANILLPLIPAFAVGFRMLRRRQRRSEEK